MGDAVEQLKPLGRPPADWLFCRSGVCVSQPEVAAPAIAEDERAHFAEHFAESFAAALNEARGAAYPSAGAPR